MPYSPPPPSGLPGYPTSTYGMNPVMGALGGLFKGAIQSFANYGANPRGGGGLATILGGAVNGYDQANLRRAQVQEVARQEYRTHMDAVLKYSQATGIPVDDVLKASGGNQFTKYDPTVSQAAGQARGNNAVANSLHVNTQGGQLGYADPGLINKVLPEVQKQIQQQSTGAVLGSSINQGQQDAGDPVAGMQPLQSTFHFVPQAQAVLGLSPQGNFTQMVPRVPNQQPEMGPTPAAPTPQATQPQFMPQGPTINPNGTINPAGTTNAFGGQWNPNQPTLAPVSGGVSMQVPASPPQPQQYDLAQYAARTPDPEMILKGWQAGSAVGGKLNDQKVTLYDQQQSELSNREQAALQGANAKDRTDAYREQSAQIKNVVQLLHSGSPEEQQVAKENLLKSGSGSKGLTAHDQSAMATAALDNAPYAKNPSARQLILNQVEDLRRAGYPDSQLKAITDQLPRAGVPMAGDPPAIALPPPKPRAMTPAKQVMRSRPLLTAPYEERVKGTIFDR
jgi:hypothetical protein